MTDSDMTIALSPLDEQHFGIRTANASYVTAADLEQVLVFCQENAVQLLVSRCSATDLEAVHGMEANGFLLMDTLIYYRLRLGNSFPYDKRQSIEYRPVLPGEEEIVRDVALKAFKDYISHYKADNKLDDSKCDEVYSNWAYQACLSRGNNKEVLVFLKKGEITGFVLLEIKENGIGEIPLTGIDPSYQGLGIYPTIAHSHWEWLRERGVKHSQVSTQITNFNQQKYFCRFGYQPTHAVYTLHKWFD